MAACVRVPVQDGCITKDEFAKVMMSIGVQLTDEEVAGAFAKHDVDGDGGMSPDEFIRMMSQRQCNPEHEMREVM